MTHTPTTAEPALDWYASRARDLNRYLAAKNFTGVEAVVTELALDNGARAMQEATSAQGAMDSVKTDAKWKLVPVEPTEEIKDAYYDLIPIAPNTETWAMTRLPSAQKLWAAMLAASPARATATKVDPDAA